MTKQEIITTLEQLITKHGFSFGYYNMDGGLPHVVQANDDYCAISLYPVFDFDADTHQNITTITAQGRVCCMNPNASTDELRAAADQIMRGAALTDEINALQLTFIGR